MTNFTKKRHLFRAIGIVSGFVLLLSLLFSWHFLVNLICGIVLSADIVIIAVTNRCPFCHKSLRLAPIKGEESCPHCGCKIH